MLPHPLTNFEIQKSCRNELRFKGVYSGNNLSKIKGGAYVINLDRYKSIGGHCIAFYVNYDVTTSYDSFGVEHIPKVIKKFIGNRNIITHILRIQAFDSMCGYLCTGFIDFMLKGKSF